MHLFLYKNIYYMQLIVSKDIIKSTETYS